MYIETVFYTEIARLMLHICLSIKLLTDINSWIDGYQELKKKTVFLHSGHKPQNYLTALAKEFGRVRYNSINYVYTAYTARWMPS